MGGSSANQTSEPVTTTNTTNTTSLTGVNVGLTGANAQSVLQTFSDDLDQVSSSLASSNASSFNNLVNQSTALLSGIGADAGGGGTAALAALATSAASQPAVSTSSYQGGKQSKIPILVGAAIVIILLLRK